MTGKSTTQALALVAGLLSLSGTALAHDQKVAIGHGQSPTAAASVSHNANGSGVTVYRGYSDFVPRGFSGAEPVAAIGGEYFNVNDLEPVRPWFLDRAEGRLLYCYGQQSTYVGAGRRIRCVARRL